MRFGAIERKQKIKPLLSGFVLVLVLVFIWQKRNIKIHIRSFYSLLKISRGHQQFLGMGMQGHHT